MYKIEVDRNKKLVTVEVIGCFNKSEILSFVSETEVILNQFGKKEVSILMLMDRADPVSQEDSPLLSNSLSSSAEYIKKIANVHKKVVTRMQMQRMENEVNKITGETLEVGKFFCKKDAMDFLEL